MTDALGRTVTVRAAPRRIISVAPSVTEVLFALGLDREIAGVSSADDYPPAGVARKPRVGGVVLDVERIVRLRPDLIVGMPSLQRGQLERLIALRLPVVAVDAMSVPGVYAQVEFIGAVTARRAAAATLVALMRAREQAVEGAVRHRPLRAVYVEIWNEPLMTAGGDTIISDLITRAGGVNVFASARGWPEVSAESVVRRSPEAIILTYPGRTRVLARPGWGDVAAIRTGRVAEVDGSLVTRPGPRIISGLERVARIVHPEAFP